MEAMNEYWIQVYLVQFVLQKARIREEIRCLNTRKTLNSRMQMA